MEKETFTLTLTDNDGTNGKSSISVDISKLKESGHTGLNDADLTALKLFSPESAMELSGGIMMSMQHPATLLVSCIHH